MNEILDYRVSDIVEHISTKKWYFVLEINIEKEMVLCRTKNHETFWFHKNELIRR